MKIYTKQSLISELKNICSLGWIESGRHGNQGGIGNTLEDLLGIEENNLPVPNAAEWELKTQRLNTTSLTTLFHIEPSPRAIRFVPRILLPLYGWIHQEAGKKYSVDEMSFRQTIHGGIYSDRGFRVVIDREQKKVLITFDYSRVDIRHSLWLKSVEDRIGLGELEPQPYWGFDDLRNKAGTKLLNTFFVQAKTSKISGKEHFMYCKVLMLERFSFDNFLNEIENGNILVDFDARTGHNHGTKFRLRQNCFPLLYDKITTII